MSGIWYEVARIPNSEKRCVNITIDPFTMDNNSTVVFNMRHVSTISGYTKHHYLVEHYPMDRNVLDCIFIQKFGDTLVIFKVFLINEELVFICGYYKNSPDPLIMILSRDRIIDSDDHFNIIVALQTIGLETRVSWTDQTSELCSSVRLVAPCALIVFAMAVNWMKLN